MKKRTIKGPIYGAFGPHFLGRGGCEGSVMVPFEIAAMVVSYTGSPVSILTTALSLTIRQQFAVNAQTNRGGYPTLWGKIWRGRG